MTDRLKPSTISDRPHHTLKSRLKFALQMSLLLVMLLAFGGVAYGGLMIMFRDLQSGATMLGLAAAAELILGIIMYKGVRNFCRGGYFWEPPPTMTEVEVSTIPLDARPVDAAVNPVTGFVYVATSDGSVTTIDPNTDKIVARSKGQLAYSPIQIAIENTTNQVLAILKGGILVKLDGSTLQKSSSLPSFSQNLDGIAVNPGLQRAYLISGKAKAVFVCDTNSDTIIKKIELDYTPTGIAADPASRRVFVAYANIAAVSVIDETSMEMIEQIVYPVPGAALSWTADVYVNSGNQMVYVLLRSMIQDGNGAGHELDSLYVLDGAAKTFVDCRSCRLDWKSQTLLSDEGFNYFAIDEKSGTVFLTSVSKKKLFAFSPQGGEPLYSLKIGRGCKAIAASPHANKVYVCYHKTFGGNSIEIISLGETKTTQYELPSYH